MADAADLKSASSNGVSVQIRVSPPLLKKRLDTGGYFSIRCVCQQDDTYMKEVKAYQCTDGTMKTNKREALIWERTLELRGIIQKNGCARDGTMTPTTVATEIVNNFDEINRVVQSYRRKISAAEKAIVAKVP